MIVETGSALDIPYSADKQKPVSHKIETNFYVNSFRYNDHSKFPVQFQSISFF